MKKNKFIVKAIFFLLLMGVESILCMEPWKNVNVYDVVLDQFTKDTTSVIWSRESYYKHYSTPLLEMYLNFLLCSSSQTRFEPLATSLGEYWETRRSVDYSEPLCQDTK